VTLTERHKLGLSGLCGREFAISNTQNTIGTSGVSAAPHAAVPRNILAGAASAADLSVI
jgi:hypothetical protein